MAGTYGDLVVNGSFTSGTTSWWAGNPANITLTAPGTGVEAAATTAAVNMWDAVFGQDNIELRAGCQYTLSFTARASQPNTTLRAAVALGADPWTPTLDKTVSVGLSDVHFVMEFTSSLTTLTGQVSFQMGQETEVTVFLTEVRLTCSTIREAFYVDPDNNAQKWVDLNPGDPRAPKILKAIARRPGAKWFGDWNLDIQGDIDDYVSAAAAVGKLPILTIYNIYWRDNGGESTGGAADPAAYRAWIDLVAAGIGNRPCLVVVEPDSLAQAEYLPTPQARSDRYALVTYAAQTLATLCPMAQVYLDGANATWIKPVDMAARLVQGGISHVKRFAVGTANFDATDISCGYGNQIAAALANLGVNGAKFIVDTSRNGNGAMDDNGQHVDYCNPAGRRLGVPSSIGVGGAEYLLWVKFPGDSDGQCGTAPPGTPAGTFSPFLAENLINGT